LYQPRVFRASNSEFIGGGIFAYRLPEPVAFVIYDKLALQFNLTVYHDRGNSRGNTFNRAYLVSHFVIDQGGRILHGEDVVIRVGAKLALGRYYQIVHRLGAGGACVVLNKPRRSLEIGRETGIERE
jgi:hypothetical protein